MLECVIEKSLVDQVKRIGGKAYKFVSPGNRGVPDRILLLPGGRIVFVELKSSSGKSTPIQMQKQKEIAKLGFPVFVVNSKAGVNQLLKDVVSNVFPASSLSKL
jgi:hypothetical protein